MSSSPPVFSVDPQNFQADVIERSQQVTVLVLFFAEQVPESLDMRRALETRVNAESAKLALALVDVAVDQSLAQHLQVRGLPSIRVVKGGQLVDQLDGPQTPVALTEFCDRLTVSSSDLLREQLDGILLAGDFDSALGLLQQAINEEPNNAAFRVELADVLIQQGNLTDAASVLGDIADDAPGIERPQTRLSIVQETADYEAIEALAAAVAEDESDLDAKYRYSLVLATQGRMEEALETALDILCADRKFRDDIGRLTMLRLFALLPRGSELAGAFRRRMFNFMH